MRSAPSVDPNTLAIEMGHRESVLKLKAPHWTVRGLECSHGTQYHQRALVTASAPGIVIENCLFKEALHRGRLGWVDGNRFYGPKLSGINPYSKWSEPELGKLVESSSQMAGSEFPLFNNPKLRDYRTTSDLNTGVTKAPVTSQGKTIDLVPLNRHDYHCPLRFPRDPTPNGAYRSAPGNSTLEIEWKDGELERK